MPGAFRARRGAVIFDDLRAIQLRYGFLPKAELEGLSQRTQTPLYQIHSVASFYPHFDLVPPPKAEIRVCADMSCHLNGACELRAGLERRFVNSRPDDIREPHPEQTRIACKADPYGENENYGVARKLVQSKAWDDVLAKLKAAELKGMGGAGFPTSLKWDLVRKQADPVKY